VTPFSAVPLVAVRLGPGRRFSSVVEAVGAPSAHGLFISRTCRGPDATHGFFISGAGRAANLACAAGRKLEEYDHVTHNVEYIVEMAEPGQRLDAPRPQDDAASVRMPCDARPGHMIRAIVFDWGGVIMRTVEPGWRLAWDARLGLEPGSVSRLFFDSDAWQRAQLGQADEADVWARLSARQSLSPEALAELRQDFWAGDRVDDELVQLIRSLRPRFKIGLLSNFATSLRAWLERCSLEDAFDAIVISGEQGLAKPQAQIYQLAAERLGVPIGECLFVDDFAENVAGARRAGMQALHFAPGEAAMAQLRQLALEG
jgi:epoxide hydrolase-like predicted phosphatase